MRRTSNSLARSKALRCASISSPRKWSTRPGPSSKTGKTGGQTGRFLFTSPDNRSTLNFDYSLQSIRQPDYLTLWFYVILAQHPCRPFASFPKSHGIISFTDSHPLTLLESYRFKKMPGRGYSRRSSLHSFRSANVPHPCKSLPHNPFADHHPLNLYHTILYNNGR